ncbi:MAG: M23 family metallopeptidase [Flavobacteriaceae bacterium]|nr:M23 family metallopeptidase [Flavobacteriaceae bacterium]
MNQPKKNIAKKLVHSYRWLIVDENTNESKISIKLNILNLLLIGAFLVSLIIGLTLIVLKYSPLKTYFVEKEESFDVVKSKNELLQLNERIMALEDSIAINSLFLDHIQQVVSGKIKSTEVDSMMAKGIVLLNDKSLRASPEDSIFREQIAKEELEAIKKSGKSESSGFLYPPVRGIVTGKYDITENHLATDIAARSGEEIKVIADGIVVFSDWNPDTGNSIIIQHNNDMMSMYKHCSKLFKNVGDEVEKGDVIAAVGNTGELTTGPHLHFELWIQGKAVDAEQFIQF